MSRDPIPPTEQIADDDHVTVKNIATNPDGNVIQAGVIHGGITIRSSRGPGRADR